MGAGALAERVELMPLLLVQCGVYALGGALVFLFLPAGRLAREMVGAGGDR